MYVDIIYYILHSIQYVCNELPYECGIIFSYHQLPGDITFNTFHWTGYQHTNILRSQRSWQSVCAGSFFEQTINCWWDLDLLRTTQRKATRQTYVHRNFVCVVFCCTSFSFLSSWRCKNEKTLSGFEYFRWSKNSIFRVMSLRKTLMSFSSKFIFYHHRHIL